jgi:hypothetical protein
MPRTRIIPINNLIRLVFQFIFLPLKVIINIYRLQLDIRRIIDVFKIAILVIFLSIFNICWLFYRFLGVNSLSPLLRFVMGQIATIAVSANRSNITLSYPKRPLRI